RPQSFGRLKREPVFKQPIGDVIVQAFAEEDKRDAVAEDVIYPIWLRESTIRIQNFHAKFYAGIFPRHVEVLQTSYNIFEGENGQLESMVFRTYDREDFMERFIRPLGLEAIKMVPDSAIERTSPVGCVVCGLKDSDWVLDIEEYEACKWEILPTIMRKFPIETDPHRPISS
ncbi:MAG: hypothetical protein KAW09_12665, partial [Thermoplasmata archaeon]|nr:hypothetical protein [Thermoplasmata archaeon]